MISAKRPRKTRQDEQLNAPIKMADETPRSPIAEDLIGAPLWLQKPSSSECSRFDPLPDHPDPLQRMINFHYESPGDSGEQKRGRSC